MVFLYFYTMYDEYTNYIQSVINNPIHTINFKSNASYTYVLEHVSPYAGIQYLQEIYNRFQSFFLVYKNHFIKLSQLNDSIGIPNKYVYDNFTECSPTNLRYIFQSLLILQHVVNSKVNNINFIEIGGGYGGLCFFIHNIAHIFDIKINSYTIFDLPVVNELQKKYLANFNLEDVRCFNISNYEGLKPNSFLISNYAFSEISIELQKEYSQKIINPYVSHGFLAWNFIEIYPFIENVELSVEQEYPITSSNNYYIRF